MLLLASYYFYMSWRPEYIILIIVSTLIDYFAALQMGRAITPQRKKIFLLLSLFTNLGLLFTFKYFNFFNDSVRAAFNTFNIFYDVPAFQMLLPVGISFYTFQTMSYSIDVYRGIKEPERHLGVFALYVSFFPQLVAGPIERSTTFLPQLFEKHEFNAARAVSGLKQMLWGFFKKLVVADRLATYVDAVYNNPQEHSGLSMILATVFFAFQIYCDFSGYSDIAIGGARILGFDLMENFKRPYFAKSTKDFWARWHISLSTWFRDYVYIPLGGNRVVKWRWYYNLFITFLISGLWHGANWTFIFWGALHGVYLVLAIWFTQPVSRISGLLGLKSESGLNTIIHVVWTFTLASFAWIFFRANQISDAFLIIEKIFTFQGPVFLSNLSSVAYGIFGILLLLLVEFQHEYGFFNIKLFNNTNVVVRYSSYAAVVLLILLIGVFDGSQFIYFQF